MGRRVAQLLAVAPKDVEYVGAVFRMRGAAFTFAWHEVAERLNETGSLVEATGVARSLLENPTFSVGLCDVQVDPDTGHVRILCYTIFQHLSTRG